MQTQDNAYLLDNECLACHVIFPIFSLNFADGNADHKYETIRDISNHHSRRDRRSDSVILR